MSLPSPQLDAFLAVARGLSFSGAARGLRITQSALSQRIGKLEEELGTALFVRAAKGVTITEAGQRLLRYCQLKESLESEVLQDLRAAPGGELGGIVRIAAYSSVLRSVVLPSLGSWLRRHPGVQCHFFSREMSELPGFLRRGEADFVVMDEKLPSTELESIILGEERYVEIMSRDHPASRTYLDHDPNDTLTERLLGRKPESRSYLDEIYAILDGVEAGLGRALVPRHLIRPGARLRVRALRGAGAVPVVLHYRRQPYYTKLQQAVIDRLRTEAPKRLA
jgi:DNA-binding transcriptional LysR family regulator